LLLAVTAAAAEPDPLAGKPPFRRLFLDATVVEESHNLQRVFHAATRHPKNPLIVKDRDWEGWGPYLYGTVLREDGLFRMWYQVIGDEAADACYAESRDGIAWTKPDLGIIARKGSTKNNIVAAEGVHIPSVVRLPDDNPRGRYAMYSFGGDLGPHVGFSPDGLRWTWPDDPACHNLFASSDVLNVFYDPYGSRFVATYKTATRRHRSVGLATSKDGVKWTKPTEAAVFTADDLDPDATQIYGMPVFPYQGLYIGLPWIYHARFIKYGRYSPERMYEAQEGSPLTVDVQLAWSWDLQNWTRTPERAPFLPLGPKGAWDWGMVYTARAPVQVGDELWFYYGGFDGLHDKGQSRGAIGLATLRLDGFCSMRAGRSEGWLISRREVIATPAVTINARTGKSGYVTAELLDRAGRVLPGFSRKDCLPFAGDSVRAVLRWKTAAFPAKAENGDVRIRFFLRNADLYSYVPHDVDTAVDDGFRDH
jgi:hypothetical protein